MKRTVVYLLIISVALFSCSSKRSLLTGTWTAVKLENPQMDTFFMNSQHYIDTIGKANNEAANMALYGTNNMDSVRGILQAQYDTAKAMQTNAVANTIFRFRADSVAFLTFNGVTDSARWYMDKNDKLIMDDLNDPSATEKVKMEIVKLDGSMLKLRFREDSTYSTVTFRRQGK